MGNANSSAPILNLASASGQARVRAENATRLSCVSAEEAAAERLHWALRASFRALNPRVWFKTRERRGWGAA